MSFGRLAVTIKFFLILINYKHIHKHIQGVAKKKYEKDYVIDGYYEFIWVSLTNYSERVHVGIAMTVKPMLRL